MEKTDYLNREAFIDQLMRVVKHVSSDQSATCFALNGPWGCGKSFVLDRFEKKLNAARSEWTGRNQYFVIRYNCWKYDYYEEPLVAIVATMIAMIERKAQLFPEGKQKQEILSALKATGVALLNIANSAVKKKTGLDLKEAYEIGQQFISSKNSDDDASKAYDAYFDFNKAVAKLSSLLQELADKFTIVFLVDELDRCLPEYAIKVLERLHHLTEGNSNIVTVIAIDKEQLMSSVKQIFGFKKPEKYLEKFFQFEMRLDFGSMTGRISEKFANYFALFDHDVFPVASSVEECVQAIFMNLDIRTQEVLVKKAMLAHKLNFADKKDDSFLCMELLLATMICIYQDESCFLDIPVDVATFENVFDSTKRPVEPPFAAFFQERFENLGIQRKPGLPGEPTSYVLSDRTDLYGAILYTWYWMHKKHPSVVIQRTKGDAYEQIARNYKELKKFAETLRLMK